MAKLYLRKDSPMIWVTFSHKGVRYRRKTKYINSDENMKKAEEELPIFMRKVKSGELILDKVDFKTFKYFSDLMLKSKIHLRDTTYSSLLSKTKIINNEFGDRNIADIKASEIKSFILNKPIKVSSMKKYLYLIRQVFDEAVLDEEISDNIADKVKLPKEKNYTEIKPFSKEEVNRLLLHAKGYMKNMLAVALYTGIRTGELLALKWQNIDYNNKKIYIDSTVGNYKESATTKTGRGRYVPIFDVLVPYLKEQEKQTGLNTYLFTNHLGTTLKPSNIYRYEWLPLLKRAKVPRRRLYDTRHTFATNMLDSKAFTLNQIANWLGHSSVQTLIRHYNKFIDSEINKFESNIDVFSTKKDINVTKNDTNILRVRSLGA